MTVRLMPGVPAAAELGLRLFNTGAGLVGGVIVKGKLFEVPPPGAGVKAVTLATPGEAISAAVMLADSWLREIKLVGRSTPFHLIVELGSKLVPVAIILNPGAPAEAVLGFRLSSAGVGAAGLIKKDNAFDGGKVEPW
jgi:hypothetical protein